MTERTPRPGLESHQGSLHFQISKLLVGAVIGAIAATGALIVATVIVLSADRPPPPGPGGPPPPPMETDGVVTLTILTGLFVLTWLAVLVASSRDMILRRLRELPALGIGEEETEDVMRAMVEALRIELAEDRKAELAMLEDRITFLTTEYGERRETDGYLNGMRTAVAGGAESGAEIRSIRRGLPKA